MKNTFVVILFCIASLTCLAQSDPTRGKMHAPEDIETTLKEARWGSLQAVLDAVPRRSYAGHFAVIPSMWGDYFRWQEKSRLLMRELGLRYQEKYPDDPRIWTWFVATVSYPPTYISDLFRHESELKRGLKNEPIDVPIDTVAKERWTNVCDELRSRFLSSPQVTEEMRVTVLYAESSRGLQVAFRDAMQGKAVEWSQWRLRVLEEARICPGTWSETRVNVERVLKATRRWEPTEEAAFLTAIATSPSIGLKNFVGAPSEIERAKKTGIELKFTALDGRRVDTNDWKGKVVLIDFWASTWCGICEMELPELKTLYAKYHALGFEVVGFALERKPSDRPFLENYIKTHDIPWPQFFDGTGTHTAIAQRFGINAIPEYFLLDEKGCLIWRRSEGGGFDRLEALLQEKFSGTHAR